MRSIFQSVNSKGIDMRLIAHVMFKNGKERTYSAPTWNFIEHKKLKKLVEKFRDMTNEAYRDDKSAYIMIGGTSINLKETVAVTYSFSWI